MKETNKCYQEITRLDNGSHARTALDMLSTKFPALSFECIRGDESSEVVVVYLDPLANINADDEVVKYVYGLIHQDVIGYYQTIIEPVFVGE